ncbi:MAG: hypothetical protein ABW133_14630 [Polyangiaceae bacterium]
MTMKIELSDEMAVRAMPEAKASPVERQGVRRALSRWMQALRGALSRYIAHNEMAWERMADAQARDPNRH